MRKNFLPWTENLVEGEIALSTRLRLARNLSDYPFPGRLNTSQREEIEEKVRNVFKGMKEFKIVDFKTLPSVMKGILMERHLVSPEFLRVGRLLVVQENQEISLMVNEEDHLRLQVFSPSLSLREVLEKGNKLDDFLSRKIGYSYSKKFGYLTACPTNLGTGLRISVMFHLPALTLSGRIKRIFSTLSHRGFTVRGIFGEEVEAVGYIYQISNQKTLGLPEEEIVDEMNLSSQDIVAAERKAREELLRKKRVEIEDKVYRSLGLLTHARLLSFKEAAKALSLVRLGLEMNLISGLGLSKINELWFLIRPAHLSYYFSTEFTPGEENEKRADLLRKEISTFQAKLTKSDKPGKNRVKRKGG
jgi:protein arginine kinase